MTTLQDHAISSSSKAVLGTTAFFSYEGRAPVLDFLYRRNVAEEWELQTGMQLPGWPTIGAKQLLLLDGEGGGASALYRLSYSQLDAGVSEEGELLRTHIVDASGRVIVGKKWNSIFSTSVAPQLLLRGNYRENASLQAIPALSLNTVVGSDFSLGAEFTTFYIRSEGSYVQVSLFTQF